jgi:hypothetical protein
MHVYIGDLYAAFTKPGKIVQSGGIAVPMRSGPIIAVADRLGCLYRESTKERFGAGMSTPKVG